jgi:hypothetical protein
VAPGEITEFINPAPAFGAGGKNVKVSPGTARQGRCVGSVAKPTKLDTLLLYTLTAKSVKSEFRQEGVLIAEKLKPGDYIGLYIDDKLIYTGILKDQGEMQSGRNVYQLLLVKNIFQRNFPEIHFDADIRAVTWEQVQEEIKRLKIKLQKNIEQMEGEVERLISEKELHNIIG